MEGAALPHATGRALQVSVALSLCSGGGQSGVQARGCRLGWGGGAGQGCRPEGVQRPPRGRVGRRLGLQRPWHQARGQGRTSDTPVLYKF